MAGIVEVDSERRWTVSNWVWRAVFDRVQDEVVDDVATKALIDAAIRGGLHYLDLRGVSTHERALLGAAVRSVRNRYSDEGLAAWVAPVSLQDFLASVDDLVAILPTD